MCILPIFFLLSFGHEELCASNRYVHMQKCKSVGIYGTTTLLTYLRALLNLCIGSLGTFIHFNILIDFPRNIKYQNLEHG